MLQERVLDITKCTCTTKLNCQGIQNSERDQDTRAHFFALVTLTYELDRKILKIYLRTKNILQMNFQVSTGWAKKSGPFSKVHNSCI